MAQPVIARETYGALNNWRYLNQASLGLVPLPTTEVMVQFLQDIAQNGNILMSDEVEAHILDGVRVAAAKILDAPLRAIALVGGASEALGQIAAYLCAGDEQVVLVSSDFPSVTYPWLNAQNRLGTRIRWVDDRPEADLTTAILEAMSDHTSVVCVSAVQFSTGTQIDVPLVVKRAHEMGARVVVDVTQMAGAMPVSMKDWGADALVCSGYKWLSTHGGIAIMAVSDRLLERAPLLVGWKGTDRPFDFHPQSLSLAPDARRYELSTSAYSSAVGLQHSINILLGAGIRRLLSHAKALSLELEAAVQLHGWRPFRPVGSLAASSHIVSLRHPTLSPGYVQQTLAEQYHIIVSARGGGIRVSLHGYNDSADVNALAEALGAVGYNA
jgi:cysteine desulfurase / selenocysteine lyase